MRFTITVTIMAVCGFLMPVQAADLHVPSQYATISAAVNAASTGDTVHVAAGTYTGTANAEINISGKDIRIQGDSGAAATIIDGMDTDKGILIFPGQGGQTTVQGLTIRRCGKNYTGGVALFAGSNAAIAGCIIEDCGGILSGSEGGGIRIHESTATISNTVIRNCEADFGGGMNILTNCSVTITGTEIYSCTGGGIYIADHSSVTIRDSDIHDNQAGSVSYMAGIGCYSSSTMTLDSTYITGNTNNYSGGGGIRIEESQPVITNCVISDNYSAMHGSAMLYRASAGGSVRFCTLAGNQSGNGNAVYVDSSNPEFKNCILWNELETHEFEPPSPGGYTVTYCDVRDSIPGMGNMSEPPDFQSGSRYHLASSSPCIDAGINCSVTVDIDGDSRPCAMGFDLGADEYTAASGIAVTLDMPSAMYSPGDVFYLDMHIFNPDAPLYAVPVFCILDVYSQYFFWPTWSGFDYEARDLPGASATTTISVLPTFNWPGGTGSASGINIYGACTTPSITAILGSLDMVTFGWAE